MSYEANRTNRTNKTDRTNTIMGTLIQDLRYGARTLLKRPVVTLIAVLSLALGIGANTAIFSLLDAVMLKSLPVQQPERLVLFGKGENMGMTMGFPSESWDLFSYPFLRRVQQRSEIGRASCRERV